MIIPRYVEDIVIYDIPKNKKLIEKAGYQFEGGECILTMEFYDGVAYEVNGTGLMLRYPKMEEISASKDMQRRIIEYTGIDDGTLSQFDVALEYGELELSDKESDKVIHTTSHEQTLRDETLILLSADIYNKVYGMSDDYLDYHATAMIVRELGDKFEKDLQWTENDDRDYIFELEKFEEEELKKLEKKYAKV